MAQTDRHRRIGQWLAPGRTVARERMLSELEISAATLKRDIAFMRDRLNMPIVWDREQQGWRLDPGQAMQGAQYELPGLWFSADEVHALLTMQHLLAGLDPGGLLSGQIDPLRRRLAQLLGTGAPPQAEVARRIKVLTVGARRIALPHFQALAGALLQRQRADITYRSRSSDATTQREISPQRLVHYRDNWYLDAWCHWRAGLRSFSLDAIAQVQVIGRAAVDINDQALDDALGAGYGIFAVFPAQAGMNRVVGIVVPCLRSCSPRRRG